MIIRAVTLGCKVNQVESASIVAALNKLDNHINASEGLDPADVYILNTCSVTAEADRKSRQYITKMTKLNNSCSIIVVGCSSQNDPKKFNKSNVIAVGGTENKTEFVLSVISSLLKSKDKSIILDRILFDKNTENFAKNCKNYSKTPQKSVKTRDFIKVQDGCDRFCTYCIIPYLRGRSRSRSIADIVDECKRSVSKELVITGIDVSDYGKGMDCSLTDLLRALSDIPIRKRLSSLECEAISEELLQVMADGDYCPHFHLSLQSGCDDVLKSMNRHYDTAFYYSKIELIRKYFPLAGIMTDIIVGFPTENDNFFANTVDFAKKCAFSDIHVFPYSSRVGTTAARKYTPLPKDLVSERVQTLLTVKKELHRNFLVKNLGTVSAVYIEDKNGEYNEGYSPNYIKVYSKAKCGCVTDLKLSEIYKDGVIGVPIY